MHLLVSVMVLFQLEIRITHNNYRSLAKEGPWAIHLTFRFRQGGGPTFVTSILQLHAKSPPRFTYTAAFNVAHDIVGAKHLVLV